MGQRRFTNPRNVFNKQMPAGDQGHYSQAHSLRLALDYRLNCLLQKVDLLHRIGGDQRTLPFYRVETSHQIIPVIIKFASFYMLKLALARRCRRWV